MLFDCGRLACLTYLNGVTSIITYKKIYIYTSDSDQLNDHAFFTTVPVNLFGGFKNEYESLRKGKCDNYYIQQLYTLCTFRGIPYTFDWYTSHVIPLYDGRMENDNCFSSHSQYNFCRV